MNIPKAQLRNKGKSWKMLKSLIFWTREGGEVEGSLAQVGGKEPKDDDEENKEGDSVHHLVL